MALPTYPAFPAGFKDRGIFYQDRATGTTIQKPVLDTRLDCRQNNLGTACESDDFDTQSVSIQLNDQVDCVSTPLLGISLQVTYRVTGGSTISEADVVAAINTYVLSQMTFAPVAA